jgi:hypothetical protein
VAADQAAGAGNQRNFWSGTHAAKLNKNRPGPNFRDCATNAASSPDRVMRAVC